MTLRDLFSEETLQKVAQRRFVERDSYGYSCEEGLCVVGALMTEEFGAEWTAPCSVDTTLYNKRFPTTSIVQRAIRLHTGRTLTGGEINEIIDLVNLNDLGYLRESSEVARRLGIAEEGNDGTA